MKTIYLAGPMDFVSEQNMTKWRDTATKKLQPYGYKTLDPVRRPHHHKLTNKEIFNLDMIDIKDSDLLLVDCRDLKVPTFGTPCEVFYASYILKKPVIGWYDAKTDPFENSVFQSVLFDRRFDSLSNALSHIVEFY